jgi:aerobic carbon-monoxide dehydrogenase medium subunit
MIPFNFEYHKPTSIKEAVSLYQQLFAHGYSPLYYGGGTEIITYARMQRVRTNAVIDIKGIPECQVNAVQNNHIVVGSAVTLTELQEQDRFSLLAKTVSRAADRTARNKITVGGNICGRIMYREAVLSFLLADSRFVIAGKNGVRTVSIHDVFVRRIRLEKGEFLAQIWTDARYASMPFVSTKRTRSGNVGYPIVTLTMLRVGSGIRIALSGVCGFPFRGRDMEAALSQRQFSIRRRIDTAIRLLPAPVLSNEEASAEYRAFVLRHELTEALTKLAHHA